MAVTEALSQFWQKPHVTGEGQNTDYPWEMAMKKKLITGAVVLLLASWFVLDAVAIIVLA
jgi:hypothetical protein